MNRLGFAAGASLHVAQGNNMLFGRRQHSNDVGFFDSSGDQRAILNGYDHFKKPPKKYIPEIPSGPKY